MLVAAAVCPHPPTLVPAMAGGAAGELDSLRAVCLDAVRRLCTFDADIVVVGGGSTAGEWDGTAGGSLRTFGVDVAFGGGDPVLPLSLTVGAYLLDEVRWPHQRRRYVAVTDATSPDDCAAIGADLAHGDRPLTALVMGDGSAKRTTTSPGYVDYRAIGYDRDVLAALEGVDVDALLGLQPRLAGELWVAGRPAWQLLAGAARAAHAGGASVQTQVRFDDAPFGVGYAVVDWTVKPG